MIKYKSIEITSNEIDEYLKQELKQKEVCDRMLQQRIMAAAAADRGISVSDAEIEAEANKIRSFLKLEKAADTLAWLEDNFLSPDRWEIAITNRLLSQKLAQQMFGSEIEAYFAKNRLDFDRFVLYQLVVPHERLAKELFYQVEEEEMSFYQAAHLYDLDPQRRHVCGYEGEVHRWDYHPDLTAAIFKTPVAVGELIGPLKSKEGYHLFKIEDYLPAKLTPQVRQEILDELFEGWLNSELEYFLHNE